MMLTGKWMQAGVWNVEQLNPDPFLAELGTYGLPWHEIINPELPHQYDI